MNMFLPKFLTPKKLILLFVACSLLFLISSKPLHAFSTQGGASYQLQFEQAITNPEMNLQSFVYETMKAVGAASGNLAIGCVSCTGDQRKQNPGLIMDVGGLIAGIYASPPASGVQYLADLGKSFGIVEPAFAQEQTTGFRLMKPVREIWTAFRNIAYVFFVLIFVFVGFAIMFRVKISPQAVITIQSALPKLIVALILVTFSYAIVGFMIDLMYVLMALISYAFIGDQGIIKQAIPVLGPVIAKLAELSKIFPDPITRIAVANSIFFSLASLIAFIVALLFGPISWLIALVAIILILIAVIRCLWTILKAYTMIILSLIFAPFQILVGALPGSNAIGSWLRNLLANIAVLPAMIAMFYIACFLMLRGIVEIFSDIPTLLTTILSGWLIPIGPAIALSTELIQPMFLWEFFARLILPIVGLMILLMAPKISDMIQAFLAGKPFGYGAAIGEAMGPARIGAAFGLGAGAARIAREWEPVTRDRFMTVVGELQKMLSRGSSRGSRS